MRKSVLMTLILMPALLGTELAAKTDRLLAVWPEVFRHQGAWDPLKGVAFSFWAALSALSGLGV